MKIIIYSSVFYPSVGGMESVVQILADEFHNQGHKIILVTNTKGTKKNNINEWNFEVLRNPNRLKYWKLLQNADIILHNCISLRRLFPDFFYKNKLFVIHHTWYRDNNGSLDLSSFLKRQVSKYVNNCFISSAIKLDLGLKGKLIPNPYGISAFKTIDDIERTEDLIFLGRLVSDKGCSLLLESLKILKNEHNMLLNLTVVGSGPEKSSLELFSVKYLKGQIQFRGRLEGERLAIELNKHKILVVPSLWEEPFGIVALEGLACGCLVIGSEKGGLKDAIGPCGWTFPNGDEKALAKLIFEVFNNKNAWAPKFKAVPDHLDRHTPENVANAYLEFFKEHV